MDFETVIVLSLRDLNFDNLDHMLTERDIKLRSRGLAMKFHPDKQIFDDTWI